MHGPRRCGRDQPRPRPHDGPHAGQPIHALPPGPALRRVPRRGRGGIVAACRLQGLVQPRRRPRIDVEQATHGPGAGPGRRGQSQCLAGPATGRLLPGQSVPPRRRAVGHQRAERDRRVGDHPRRLDLARTRSEGKPYRVHHPARHQPTVAWRSRVLPRRVRRDRLPRPELMGPDVGQPRLRDPALRGLARLGVRRVGLPAGRAPDAVLLGPDQDRGGNRRRAGHGGRAGPPSPVLPRPEHGE